VTRAWRCGTGSPRREFLLEGVLADAVLYLLHAYDANLTQYRLERGIILEAVELVMSAIGYRAALSSILPTHEGTFRESVTLNSVQGGQRDTAWRVSCINSL
jgi:hypothetical protein